MNRKYVIGIDIGTTNTKVCLFNIPSFSLVKMNKFLTPKREEGVFTDINSEELWDKIQHSIKDISKLVKTKSNLKSISIASFAQTIVLQDENNKVLSPTIAWYDKRGKKEVQYINKVIPPNKMYDITGINTHSNHSLSKLLWIKNNVPSTYKKMRKWTCMSGFISSRLTDQFATDISLASRTLLLDINNKSWSTEIINKFSLSVNTFPKIVDSGKPIAFVSAYIADKIGLSENTTVTVSGHDHMVGSVCTSLRVGDEILNSTGTTEGLLLLNKTPNIDKQFQKKSISNGLYNDGESYTFYGSMPSAGYSFTWLKEMYEEELTDIIDRCNQIYANYELDMESLIKFLYIIIPHFKGSGPPLRSTDSKAMIYGVQTTVNKKLLTVSMIAGLCFELKQLMINYEEFTGKPIETIKVIGPAAKNPLWLQLKADILGVKINACLIEEAVSKGSAILSSIKQDFIQSIPNVDYKVYKPYKQNTEKFNYIYEKRYLPLYNLKNQFEMEVNNNESINIL